MTDSVFAAVRYGADAACARDALDNALRQARAEALRELRSKWLVRDLTWDDFALIDKEG